MSLFHEYAAGIDYSMSCPCACLHPINFPFDISNCTFVFKSDVKKWRGNWNADIGTTIIGIETIPYDLDIQRFTNNAIQYILTLRRFNVTKVAIEGYSYNSVGRVNHLSENMGLLKYGMYSNGIDFVEYAPTDIKKLAGKGNFKKEQMYDAFFSETKLDLVSLMDYKGKGINSPVNDIVDSYYLCKKLFLTELTKIEDVKT